MAPPSVSESPFFPQRADQCEVMRVTMRYAGVILDTLDRADVCMCVCFFFAKPQSDYTNNDHAFCTVRFASLLILMSHLSSLYVLMVLCVMVQFFTRKTQTECVLLFFVIMVATFPSF